MATAVQQLPGVVPATRAQRHIERLRHQGLGRRSIADASDVSDAVVKAIAQGRRTYILRSTEERILAVDRDGASDGCLVPSSRTSRLIKVMVAEGIPRRTIAERLGSQSGRFSISTRIRAATALRVERVFNQLVAS